MSGIRELVVPLLMILVAGQMVAHGARGLITRRPFVLSMRWFVIPAVLIVVAVTADAVATAIAERARPGELLTPRYLVVPIVFIVAGLLASRQLSSYAVYGVTARSLRDALVASLQGLGIEYEESLGQVQLPRIGGSVQVAVQGWNGMGQLRGSTPAARETLKHAVGRMNDYFKTRDVETNMLTCVFQLLLGGALVFVMVSQLV